MEETDEAEKPKSIVAIIATAAIVIGFVCWFAFAISANRARRNTTQTAPTTVPNVIERPRVAGVILQFNEFTDGCDDTYQILDSHIGRKEQLNICRDPKLGDSNIDSVFVDQDVD